MSQDNDQSISTDRRRYWIKMTWAVVLVGWTVIVYIPALDAGFVWSDDDTGGLTHNVVLEEDGLYRVWFTTDSINYWPMVWTSYWLEYQLWSLDPAGYHWVNVLVHAACSLLIWPILARLKIPGGWLAALLFALHPVNVESVAWITQRKNVLSLFFFLVAVLSYLRYDDQRRPIRYGFALFAFVLAMLSKGAAVMLPVVLLMCVWWLRGRINLRDVWRSLPFFAVAAVMSFVEIWFQYERSIAQDVVRDDGFAARLAGAGWAVWFYVYKALLPINLCFVYPRWQIDPRHWSAHLPNLALVALLALTWQYRRSWGRPLLFALGYYVLTLLPVLGFFDVYFMKYSLVADHWQYLAIIAIIALVVGWAASLAPMHGRVTRWMLCIFALFVLGSFSLSSWRQSKNYHDSETLLRDTVSKNPNAWMAHYNLGILLREKNQFEAAKHHYKITIQIKPDHAKAHNNLGIIFKRQGHVQEAIAHYRQALAIKANFFQAHYNLGVVLMDQGKIDQAIRSYQEALRIDATDPDLYLELAKAFKAQGKDEQAAKSYRRAIELGQKHRS